MRYLLKISLPLIATAMLAGCSGGDKAPPTAELSGEVKRMNGEPVGEVTVVFYPSKGAPTTTKTDPSGRFTASVQLGENKVAVISEASASSTDSSPEAAQKLLEEAGKVKPQFANPDSSGLSVNVSAKQADKTVFVVE